MFAGATTAAVGNTLHTKEGENGHVADTVFIIVLMKPQMSAGRMKQTARRLRRGRLWAPRPARCSTPLPVMSTHAKQTSPPTCGHAGQFPVQRMRSASCPRVKISNLRTHSVAKTSYRLQIKWKKKKKKRLRIIAVGGGGCTWGSVKHEVIREGWGRTIKWSGAVRSRISTLVHGTGNGT